MPDNTINVDPYERLKFAEKLITFEEDMKIAVQSIKSRLDTASGVLQDPGSQFFISEGNNLVESLEKLLSGSLSESGAEQKGKALKQIELMEGFAGKMCP